MTYSSIEILLSERDGKVINWSLLCFSIHKGKMTYWSPNHTSVMKKKNRRNASRKPGFFNHGYD